MKKLSLLLLGVLAIVGAQIAAAASPHPEVYASIGPVGSCPASPGVCVEVTSVVLVDGVQLVPVSNAQTVIDATTGQTLYVTVAELLGTSARAYAAIAIRDAYGLGIYGRPNMHFVQTQ